MGLRSSLGCVSLALSLACGGRPALEDVESGSSDGEEEALESSSDGSVEDDDDEPFDPGFSIWLEPGETSAAVDEQTRVWLGAWVNLSGVAAARVVLETEGPVAIPLSELARTRGFALPIADDDRVLLPVVDLTGELHLATIPVRCLDSGQGRVRARLTTALPNTVHRALQSVQTEVVCGDKSARPDRRPRPA